MAGSSATKVEELLRKACAEGNLRLAARRAKYSKHSSENEEFQVGLLREFSSDFGFDPSQIRHLKGHAFPDVLIDKTTYGIELKGAQKSTKFNGNSVFASTLQGGLNKIYIFYWIDQRTPRLDFRDYFDCVYQSEVTHSPRWKIDIQLPVGESLFGIGADKLGITSVDYLKRHPEQDQRILDDLRRRALEKGEIPWYIQVPTDESADLSPTHSGLGIRRFEQLEDPDRNALDKLLFLSFPKVLMGGKHAHERPVIWAISSKSVLITRDRFSRGGKKPIELSCGAVDFPGVFSNCQTALADPCDVRLTEISEITGEQIRSAREMRHWFRSQILDDEILRVHYERLPRRPKTKLSYESFGREVVEYLLSGLKSKSLV
jgi:hypothetical protein